MKSNMPYPARIEVLNREGRVIRSRILRSDADVPKAKHWLWEVTYDGRLNHRIVPHEKRPPTTNTVVEMGKTRKGARA
jgi:hypothetical protein